MGIGKYEFPCYTNWSIVYYVGVVTSAFHMLKELFHINIQNINLFVVIKWTEIYLIFQFLWSPKFPLVQLSVKGYRNVVKLPDISF
jgi:hypothetical protein